MKTSPSLISFTSLKFESLSKRTNLTLILRGAEYESPWIKHSWTSYVFFPSSYETYSRAALPETLFIGNKDWNTSSSPCFFLASGATSACKNSA